MLSLNIPKPLILHEITEADAAVGSGLDERNCSLFKQLDQVRPRDVENISGFLRGQFLVNRCHAHSITMCELRNYLPQQGRQRFRQRNFLSVRTYNLWFTLAMS